ncbi:MAG: 1-deoxy-D-xylulose-5-phosphate reductoisomerase [Burkholderiaceae bacterium]
MHALPTPARLTILGSTGSIGQSTLDVVARHPQRFSVYALTAATQVERMAQQCAQFRPQWAVMADALAAQALTDRLRAENLPTQVASGPEALATVARAEPVDAVMAAIVGFAGMAPCLAAAQAGKRLMLANKEALVVGGRWFMDAVAQGGATLLPIDSEHSAVFQSLPDDPSTWAERVQKIILTAAGGPFRTRDPDTLTSVTPAEAVAHPNWVMGQKISVDSATMMNKALEVIEAHHLFAMAPAQIEVVIHPQSVVHSMVQYHDGSVVAQLGTPDMRVPIAYGLSWPQRMNSGAATLDFAALGNLSFEAPDERRFPCLGLAWQALAMPEGASAVLNAANEVTVEAFLQQRLSYSHIARVNQDTLEQLNYQSPDSLEALLELDQQARAKARALMTQLGGRA